MPVEGSGLRIVTVAAGVTTAEARVYSQGAGTQAVVKPGLVRAA